MTRLLAVLALAVFSSDVLSHPGGTDVYGCHAGSEPYHCHNDDYNSSDSSSVDIEAWDVNLGYQFNLNQTQWIPFVGASLGKSSDYEDRTFGLNVGLKHQKGWYMSYVSTSESIQLGYHFIHISANSDYFGLGIRLPLGGIRKANDSSLYFSSSLLFSEERRFSSY